MAFALPGAYLRLSGTTFVTARLGIAWIYVGLAVLVPAIRRTSLRELNRTVRKTAASYLGRRGTT